MLKKLQNYKNLIIIFMLWIIICTNFHGITMEVSNMQFESLERNYASNLSDSKPEFYGTIGINLKVGDKLDLTSSTFRIFAKDFYDGDLTQSIEIIENTVDMTTEGEYYIKYSVSNTQENTTEIVVPVIVDNNQNRTIKRKIYTSEETWNTELNGVNKGNYHDRQNLGIYAHEGASIQIREINSDQTPITGKFLNNNDETETEFNITKDWTTITAQYDSVPFIKTSDINGRVTYQNSQRKWERFLLQNGTI